MFTLQLADVPLDAGADSPRQPLGTREQVAKRLSELLPGTEFDKTGRGVFRRSTYQIAFLIAGEEPTVVSVAMDQVDGFGPIARIAEKTGWRVFDQATKELVDVEASRAAAKTILAGDKPAAPVRVARERWRPSRRQMGALAAVGLVAAAIGTPWLWPDSRLAVMLPASIIASQRSALTRFEKYTDRVKRREAQMRALAASFRQDRIVEQMLDVQMASRAYWNFMDGHYSSPELLADPNVWSRFLMQPFLPASFGQAQRDGYVFEFNGENCTETEPGWPECAGYSYSARPAHAGGGPSFALFSADDKVHYRKDGAPPRREDPTIK